jgi:hypothetical protein
MQPRKIVNIKNVSQATNECKKKWFTVWDTLRSQCVTGHKSEQEGNNWEERKPGTGLAVCMCATCSLFKWRGVYVCYVQPVQMARCVCELRAACSNGAVCMCATCSLFKIRAARLDALHWLTAFTWAFENVRVRPALLKHFA